MLQQLSAQDASFIYQDTPATPMHVASVAILDPSTSPYGPLTLEAVMGFYEERLHLMVLLNDGIQDGRDVSWIYDADIELLAGHVASLVVSGDRAADLALRCHLAGLEVDEVQPQAGVAVARSLQLAPEGARVDVVATYTAMMEMRELLAEWTGAAPYWAASTQGGAA